MWKYYNSVVINNHLLEVYIQVNPSVKLTGAPGRPRLPGNPLGPAVPGGPTEPGAPAGPLVSQTSHFT